MLASRHLRGSPRHIESWIFDDVLSRNALVGATYDDIGRIGYQADDGTYWRLVAYTPTLVWEGLGTGGSGGSGDLNYRHVQMSASATWVIVHNLAKFPSVSIVDSVGDNIVGDVIYDSGNQVTVTFSAAISGEAYLN